MASLDKDQVIEKFTAAYTTANGKAPAIEAKGGWYSVDGGKNMRLAQLDELADELSAGAPKKTASKPAEAKKAAPAKKADTKKPAPKKAKKKSTGGFSVKSFWGDKITAENAGAILPR